MPCDGGDDDELRVGVAMSMGEVAGIFVLSLRLWQLSGDEAGVEKMELMLEEESSSTNVTSISGERLRRVLALPRRPGSLSPMGLGWASLGGAAALVLRLENQPCMA